MQPTLEEIRQSAVRAIGLLTKDALCSLTLRLEANAPLLGHALSLLLQVAEQEAAAGERGSRSLRGDALAAADELMKTACTLGPFSAGH